MMVLVKNDLRLESGSTILLVLQGRGNMDECDDCGLSSSLAIFLIFVIPSVLLVLVPVVVVVVFLATVVGAVLTIVNCKALQNTENDES
jgi:hypothetical protein